MRFEPVIGLEVHAQLLTHSKIFCGCSTRFGAPPNSHTCPVCLGLPGSLPVTNREAVGMAMKAGLALGCRINRHSILARKNYFYPDLPKGYQISQYERPLAEDGGVTLPLGQADPANQERETGKKRVGIIRVHLEEDAGKSIHVPAGDTQVNLNRCGVPLIEIVTHPDIGSSQEASDFLSFLRRILLYLAICDGNMEEGSLRCDANVSVREVGASRLGTKVEIKNLNSFRFLQKALDFEIGRQVDVLERGGSLQQETRLWDEDLERTSVMRTKEEAHDYRYFPDPDLLPVVVPEEWIRQIKEEIPELPDVRAERFAKEYQLSQEDALLITHSREFADYFERAVEFYRQPKTIFNWMMGELTAYLKRDEVGLGDCRIQARNLAQLVRLVDQDTISGKIAKEVFDKMCQTGANPEEIVTEEGLTQISDADLLEEVVDSVLGSNPVQVQRYRDGKEGLIGFFVGQIMKETGRAGKSAAGQSDAEKEAEPVKKSPSPLRAARQDQRIAVIEEIAADIYSVKFILQSLGYDVRSFSSTILFLPLVTEFRPALIIVDMMIPDGGGYEAIRGVRTSSLQGVPILAITAEAMEGEVEDVYQAGGQEILRKPYTVSELQEKLETLFSC